LPALQQQGIEINQMTNALWHAVCHAADADARKAVAHQNYIMQVVRYEEVCDIFDKSV
jgi:hypothetical protein